MLLPLLEWKNYSTKKFLHLSKFPEKKLKIKIKFSNIKCNFFIRWRIADPEFPLKYDIKTNGVVNSSVSENDVSFLIIYLLF